MKARHRVGSARGDDRAVSILLGAARHSASVPMIGEGASWLCCVANGAARIAGEPIEQGMGHLEKVPYFTLAATLTLWGESEIFCWGDSGMSQRPR